MEKRHRLWTLFTSMLYISTFTFGGGFVIVSLMQNTLRASERNAAKAK